MNNFINFLKRVILKEDGEPTNVVGDGTGAVQLFKKPVGMVKRKWGGKKEFTVAHEQYESLKYCSENGSAWDSHIPAGDMQDMIRKALHTDGAAIVTSDFTNASVILKHLRQKRWQAQDDAALS